MLDSTTDTWAVMNKSMLLVNADFETEGQAMGWVNTKMGGEELPSIDIQKSCPVVNGSVDNARNEIRRLLQ